MASSVAISSQFEELLSNLVSKGSSCGGLILVLWRDAVDEIDALDDVSEVGEPAQLAPAFLGALTELEHPSPGSRFAKQNDERGVQHTVTAETALPQNAMGADA